MADDRGHRHIAALARTGLEEILGRLYAALLFGMRVLIVLTMQKPEPGACALNNRGMTDYATASRVWADGLHCCIDRIVLRADGVPATTQDP